MAVIQTPQGRVIGLIVEKDDQPNPQPEPAKVEKKPEPVVAAKRPGRPAKK